tara:strand:+ start:114856 stop:116319 length:1464 start_codon:yes stop_codon:yes gene_type:complete
MQEVLWRISRLKKKLKNRINKLISLAEEMGLDFFDVNFEVVPYEVMLEVTSYGLPTRARHWSYGKSYDYQKISGEMGFSKIYEIVLNNDPSYAFLLDTNSDIANTMVAAHVFGHSAFFKNNYLFKKTDRKMVYQAAARAQRIEDYIEKYGLEYVEHIMDMGFALDKHIDWHKGTYRELYGKKETVFKKRRAGEFSDILKNKNNGTLKEVIVNENFPPHPEHDVLWFLINYGDLNECQKDILSIIREESFYFYPQYYTKIMNEGFASFIHAELMYKFDDISPAEHLDFCKIHEKVVQPGSNRLNINPYFLGFTIFSKIKEEWDKKHENGESDINGLQKIYSIVETEDDISFVHNYLTQEIVDDLGMFSYVKIYDKVKGTYIEVESNKVEDVAEGISSTIYNYRVPLISIEGATKDSLELKHHTSHIGTLDVTHLEVVMEYIRELWGAGIIDLESIDSLGEVVHYTYDELGFSHDAGFRLVQPKIDISF